MRAIVFWIVNRAFPFSASSFLVISSRIAAMAALSIASFFTTFRGLSDYAPPEVALFISLGIQIGLFCLSLILAAMLRPTTQDIALSLGFLFCLFVSSGFSYLGLHKLIENDQKYGVRAENQVRQLWITSYRSVVTEQALQGRRQALEFEKGQGYSSWRDSYIEAVQGLDAYVDAARVAVGRRVEKIKSEAAKQRDDDRASLEKRIAELNATKRGKEVLLARLEADLAARTAARTSIVAGIARLSTLLNGADGQPGLLRELLTLTAEAERAKALFERERGFGGTTEQKPDGATATTGSGYGPIARAYEAQYQGKLGSARAKKAEIDATQTQLSDLESRARALATEMQALTNSIAGLRGEIGTLTGQQNISEADLKGRTTGPASGPPPEAGLPGANADEQRAFVAFEEVRKLRGTFLDPVHLDLSQEIRTATGSDALSAALGSFIANIGASALKCTEAFAALNNLESLMGLAQISNVVPADSLQRTMTGLLRCASNPLGGAMSDRREKLATLSNYATNCAQDKVFDPPGGLSGRDGEPSESLRRTVPSVASWKDSYHVVKERLNRCLNSAPLENVRAQEALVQRVGNALEKFAPDADSHDRVISALQAGSATAIVCLMIALTVDVTVVVLAATSIGLALRRPTFTFRRRFRDATFRNAFGNALNVAPLHRRLHLAIPGNDPFCVAHRDSVSLAIAHGFATRKANWIYFDDRFVEWVLS